ncbi:MAG: PQQ-binding-like beta-propeller repeat protein [Armatimonadia bacterium]
MWRHVLLATFAAITFASLGTTQETERLGPPPMIWAVPHLQLWNQDGGELLLRGLDASIALPLSPRTNVTGTWFFDTQADDYATATFNYDHPLKSDLLLRGSVGIIQDDFGYGLTLHRSMENYGVGAFAQSVDGDFQGGLMLTHEVPWGVKLRKLPRPRTDESSAWSSGAGDVGDLGARAALVYRAGEGSNQLMTTTAYFPQKRQSWPREGHSVQSASYVSSDFAPPAKQVWKYQTEGPIRSSAAIVNGIAYVGSYDGWLYALDLSRGERLWRFPAESAITGAPAVCDDQIFFGTENGDIFCVAQPRRGGPPTGQLVWRYRSSAAVTASPLVTDSGLVIVGSCDSYIYALDRNVGKLVWKIATGGPVIASASKVSARIPAGVNAAGKATKRSDGVLIGGSDGKLYAIEEVKGQIIWTFTSDGPITSAPVTCGDRLYVTNRTGSLYALQTTSGKQLWACKIPGSVAHSPAVDEERVYVGTADGGVFALEGKTGKMLWQCDLKASLAASPTLVNGKLMYLASRDGRLWTLDRPTGRVINFHREPEPLATCAAIADGHLVVGGESGTVYAYVPNAGGLPLPPMDAADIPRPVVPIEPDRPLPPVAVAPQPSTPAGPTIPTEPATPAVLPPTTSTPAPAAVAPSAAPAAVTVTPPATPAATKPEPTPVAAAPAARPTPSAPAPETVALKPPSAPPAPSIAPPAPAATVTPTPAERVIPLDPPRDFPPATTPPSSGPKPAVIVPTPPATVPPTATVPGTRPPTERSLQDRLPLLTLALVPADGRTPTLVSNQNYLFVGGKIAPGSSIVTVRVNGLEAAIKDGAYQTQVTFPGPGQYLLVVEAITREGERSAYRRTIQVVEGLDALSPEPLALKMRGGSPIVTISPGTRIVDVAKVQKTVEIRNAKGQLVHNWVVVGDQTPEISWNGANANGKALPAGKYEISYILSGPNGPLAWIRQPVDLVD